jgi:hypothetical protein
MKVSSDVLNAYQVGQLSASQTSPANAQEQLAIALKILQNMPTTCHLPAIAPIPTDDAIQNEQGKVDSVLVLKNSISFPFGLHSIPPFPDH